MQDFTSVIYLFTVTLKNGMVLDWQLILIQTKYDRNRQRIYVLLYFAGWMKSRAAASDSRKTLTLRVVVRAPFANMDWLKS